MTVKDIADRYGLTAQAVYKRLKNSGIEISALKDAETGRLSPKGEKAILALFENKKPSEAAENTLKQEVDRLTREVDRLTLVNKQLLEKVELLEQSRDDLRQALAAEQQLHLMALKKIPEALPAGDQKQGLFTRLFRKKTN